MKRISVVLALLLTGCSYWVNGPVVTVSPATVSPATETRVPTEVPSATRETEPSSTPEPTSWPTPTPIARQTEAAEVYATALGGEWGTVFPKFGETGIRVSGMYRTYYQPFYGNVMHVRGCEEGYFDIQKKRTPQIDCPIVRSIGYRDKVALLAMLYLQNPNNEIHWSEWLCLYDEDFTYFCQEVVLYVGEDLTYYGDLIAQEGE